MCDEMKYLPLFVDDLIEVIANKLNSAQRQPYYYGTDIPICVAEIHLIEFMVENPALKTSEIATRLGLAKSVVSKTASRMEKKGLIKKYKLAHNQKDTYYQLTEQGQRAYEGHQRLHQQCIHDNWTHFSSLPEHDQRVIIAFLNDYIRYLDYLPEKLKQADEEK